MTNRLKSPKFTGIIFLNMINFFKDRILELSNITWPTQKQAIHSMITVLTIMLLVGIFLGGVDWVLNELVLTLINR